MKFMLSALGIMCLLGQPMSSFADAVTIAEETVDTNEEIKEISNEDLEDDELSEESKESEIIKEIDNNSNSNEEINEDLERVDRSFSSQEISFEDEINDGIYGLDYDKREILATQGESIDSFTPKEGLEEPGKFIVVEKQKKSLSTSPVDISIIDSVTDRTYPGALQLANQSFVENMPDVLMCDRKPMNISIDLPGMRKENTVTVDEVNYGNVSGAIDDLVSKWHSEYSDTYTVPARTQYSESMVYSKSQIATALNVNYKVLENSLGIDFDAVASGEKKVMIASYKQIFYTVSSQLPNNPADVFGDDVSFKDLQRKGVSDSSPPLMVSNVAYGRTIFVKLETESNSKDIKAAFKAVLKDGDIEAKAEYKDVLDQSTFTAVVLGGDAYEHNKIITKDFDEIREVIKENAAFSATNPAYPISYTSVFLKDNSIAAINNRTDYVETTYKEYTSGKINLDHYGAYVAQFAVNWDEFTYDENGNEIVEHRSWDGNYDDRTAHFSTVISLPANSRNIRIYARECTGLAWEWWRTVIDEYDVPLAKEINVYIGGTTLYPSSSVEFEN
ncbi:thiol-activated cytolysin family protein [Peptostreptococcaceae bacterium AGR-M142]